VLCWVGRPTPRWFRIFSTGRSRQPVFYLELLPCFIVEDSRPGIGVLRFPRMLWGLGVFDFDIRVSLAGDAVSVQRNSPLSQGGSGIWASTTTDSVDKQLDLIALPFPLGRTPSCSCTHDSEIQRLLRLPEFPLF